MFRLLLLLSLSLVLSLGLAPGFATTGFATDEDRLPSLRWLAKTTGCPRGWERCVVSTVLVSDPYGAVVTWDGNDFPIRILREEPFTTRSELTRYYRTPQGCRTLGKPPVTLLLLDDNDVVTDRIPLQLQDPEGPGDQPLTGNVGGSSLDPLFWPRDSQVDCDDIGAQPGADSRADHGHGNTSDAPSANVDSINELLKN